MPAEARVGCFMLLGVVCDMFLKYGEFCQKDFVTFAHNQLQEI